MKKLIACFVMFTGMQLSAAYPQSESVVLSTTVAPYVEFLKTAKTDPVEYVVGLFEKYDVVVFCEQFHPELNQYEFLSQVVRHPKFANTVGGIFTEVGSVSQQPVMDKFLSSSTRNDRLLVTILQNGSIYPEGWRNENIFRFWNTVWTLNSTLDDSHKVRLYLSDIPWDWQTISNREDYVRAQTKEPDRDRVMADTITKAMANYSGSKKKFLVIMNTRHALGLVKSARDGAYGKNTGTYLKLKWPGKVCNVLYFQGVMPSTSNCPVPGIPNYNPIHGGVWDAAFYANASRPVGFDLAGTPFGRDSFDFQPYFTAPDYQTAFDGLVFYKPVYQNEQAQNIPGYDSDAVVGAELKRRWTAIGKQPGEFDEFVSVMPQMGKRAVYRPPQQTAIKNFLSGLAGTVSK